MLEADADRGLQIALASKYPEEDAWFVIAKEKIEPPRFWFFNQRVWLYNPKTGAMVVRAISRSAYERVELGAVAEKGTFFASIIFFKSVL